MIPLLLYDLIIPNYFQFLKHNTSFVFSKLWVFNSIKEFITQYYNCLSHPINSETRVWFLLIFVSLVSYKVPSIYQAFGKMFFHLLISDIIVLYLL